MAHMLTSGGCLAVGFVSVLGANFPCVAVYLVRLGGKVSSSGVCSFRGLFIRGSVHPGVSPSGVRLIQGSVYSGSSQPR